MSPLDDLRAALLEAVAVLRPEAEAPRAAPTLERPKRAGHGDFATNAAMLLAPVLGRPPRDIAADLGGALAARLGDRLAAHEVAGPGFLNLTLADAWFAEAAAGVLAAGDAWGTSPAERPRRVNVEYVSANPTGPLHVGHSRNAAYGDALARLLEATGHDVHREFYVNDFGSQVANLAASVRARARGEEPPEDGYRGDYVAELAAQIPGAADGDPAEVGRQAVALMLDRARASLARLRVGFDTWFSERTLHEGEPSKVRHAFDVLEAQGRTYRHEGALWLRTTAFGDDKDRVLERSSGEHTYFASDIAYHQDKRERGFDLLLDVWGADHHGYVGRMHAAWEALGGDPADLELLIMQFVHLVEGEGRAQMSKRAGEFVTLDELVDEIGPDAARWYLLQRSHDTTMDLDLAAARDQSRENPVYYVQYAHARIASVRREVGEEAVAAALGRDPATGLGGAELHPSERALLLRVLDLPGEAAEAAARRAPHRVAAYALDLAQAFSAFYRDCRVKDATPGELRAFRLGLAVATQRSLAAALDLLGVAAPEEM